MEEKEIKLNEFECLFAVFMAFKILEVIWRYKYEKINFNF